MLAAIGIYSVIGAYFYLKQPVKNFPIPENVLFLLCALCILPVFYLPLNLVLNQYVLLFWAQITVFLVTTVMVSVEDKKIPPENVYRLLIAYSFSLVLCLLIPSNAELENQGSSIFNQLMKYRALYAPKTMFFTNENLLAFAMLPLFLLANREKFTRNLALCGSVSTLILVVLKSKGVFFISMIIWSFSFFKTSWIYSLYAAFLTGLSSLWFFYFYPVIDSEYFSSVMARANYQWQALKMVFMNPLWGNGPGYFSYHFAEYCQPDQEISTYVHHFILEKCIEYGIPVGLAILSGIFIILKLPIIHTVSDKSLGSNRKLCMVDAAAICLAGFLALNGQFTWLLSITCGMILCYTFLSWRDFVVPQGVFKMLLLGMLACGFFDISFSKWSTSLMFFILLSVYLGIYGPKSKGIHRLSGYGISVLLMVLSILFFAASSGHRAIQNLGGFSDDKQIAIIESSMVLKSLTKFHPSLMQHYLTLRLKCDMSLDSEKLEDLLSQIFTLHKILPLNPNDVVGILSAYIERNQFNSCSVVDAFLENLCNLYPHNQRIKFLEAMYAYRSGNTMRAHEIFELLMQQSHSLVIFKGHMLEQTEKKWLELFFSGSEIS